MLTVQFNHKVTRCYGELKVGDIFIPYLYPNKVFIRSDSEVFGYGTNSIDLTTGKSCAFAEDVPIIVIKNAKLIVEAMEDNE